MSDKSVGFKGNFRTQIHETPSEEVFTSYQDSKINTLRGPCGLVDPEKQGLSQCKRHRFVGIYVGAIVSIWNCCDNKALKLGKMFKVPGSDGGSVSIQRHFWVFNPVLFAK